MLRIRRLHAVSATASSTEIVGGWQTTGVLLLKTGTPFTIETGSDARGFGNLDGQNGDRPNLIDTSVLGAKVDHPDKSTRLLPKSAF